MIKTSPIRILIVDDHPVVREGLAAMIDRRPDMSVVAQAENGREALTAFTTHLPDVTLMDLQMPELGGGRNHPHPARCPSPGPLHRTHHI